ncbi:MAG: tetratricopeptide repeat protein, partial [Acidobacteria bacterium]|nr:tetratricopeptide repeat protein [Acidobacteriota bacterium]
MARETGREREEEYRRTVIDALLDLQLDHSIGNLGAGKVRFWKESMEVILGDAQQSLGKEISRRTDRAIQDLRAMVRLFPGRPDARFLLARGLLVLGHPEEARQCVEDLRASAPEFFPGTFLREIAVKGSLNLEDVVVPAGSAWARAWAAALLAARARDWKSAEAAYSLLLGEGMTDREPYLGFRFESIIGRGVVRLEMDDHEGAARDFQAARSLWPQALAPGLLLGQAYLAEGKKEAADRWFQELFDSSARQTEIAAAIAALYYAYLSDFTGALSWARRLPEGIARARAITFFSGGEEAIASAEEALRLDPEGCLTLAAAGRAFAFIPGQEDRARALIGLALEQGPDDFFTWHLVSEAFNCLGDLQKAEETARHALNLNPELRIWPLFQIGLSLFRQGRLEEA